jgi:hypothetical protein
MDQFQRNQQGRAHTLSHPTASKLRAEIARRKMTLKLAPFGIGEVLDMVDAWVASVEARLRSDDAAIGAMLDQRVALLSTEEMARRSGTTCDTCEE